MMQCRPTDYPPYDEDGMSPLNLIALLGLGALLWVLMFGLLWLALAMLGGRS